MKRTVKTYRVEVEQSNGDVVRVTATLTGREDVDPKVPEMSAAFGAMFGVEKREAEQLLKFVQVLREAGMFGNE